jgi:hypothetical protein
MSYPTSASCRRWVKGKRSKHVLAALGMHGRLVYFVHEGLPSTVGIMETSLTEDLHSLETTIRSALAEGNHDRIAKIVHQLCHDYAYAVHQPHARNGGLIGLAAAAIALGAVSLSRYLS